MCGKEGVPSQRAECQGIKVELLRVIDSRCSRSRKLDPIRSCLYNFPLIVSGCHSRIMSFGARGTQMWWARRIVLFVCFGLTTCIIVLWPGIEFGATAVKVWSPYDGTTGEFPQEGHFGLWSEIYWISGSSSWKAPSLASIFLIQKMLDQGKWEGVQAWDSSTKPGPHRARSYLTEGTYSWILYAITESISKFTSFASKASGGSVHLSLPPLSFSSVTQWLPHWPLCLLSYSLPLLPTQEDTVWCSAHFSGSPCLEHQGQNPWDFPGGPVFNIKIHLSMQGTRDRSLTWELRSPMPWGN